MKKFIIIGFVLSLVFGTAAVTSCNGATEDEDPPNGTPDPPSETFFQPELKYATTFNIELLENGCRLVTDGEDQQFLLIPQGIQAPVGYENTTKINTPVANVVLLSSTYGSLLRPFDVFDSIIGVNTIAENWYVDEIIEGMGSGAIKYIGGGSEMQAPNYEEIQTLNPDLIFMYVAFADDYTAYETLTGLGLNVVVVNDFNEEHYLGKVETMKLLATFYDKDEAADTYFSNIENNINATAAIVANITEKPDVLWGMVFYGTAYIPGNASHVAVMVNNVSGNYLFSDLEGPASSAISIEEVYARGLNADVFIYSSSPPYINSIAEVLVGAPILSDLEQVEQGQVWAFQPWYYQILDKTDEVFADLAAIVHPELFPNHTVQHYFLLPLE